MTKSLLLVTTFSSLPPPPPPPPNYTAIIAAGAGVVALSLVLALWWRRRKLAQKALEKKLKREQVAQKEVEVLESAVLHVLESELDDLFSDGVELNIDRSIALSEQLPPLLTKKQARYRTLLPPSIFDAFVQDLAVEPNDPDDEDDVLDEPYDPSKEDLLDYIVRQRLHRKPKLTTPVPAAPSGDSLLKSQKWRLASPLPVKRSEIESYKQRKLRERARLRPLPSSSPARVAIEPPLQDDWFDDSLKNPAPDSPIASANAEAVSAYVAASDPAALDVEEASPASPQDEKPPGPTLEAGPESDSRPTTAPDESETVSAPEHEDPATLREAQRQREMQKRLANVDSRLREHDARAAFVRRRWERRLFGQAGDDDEDCEESFSIEIEPEPEPAAPSLSSLLATFGAIGLADHLVEVGAVQAAASSPPRPRAPPTHSYSQDVLTAVHDRRRAERERQRGVAPSVAPLQEDDNQPTAPAPLPVNRPKTVKVGRALFLARLELSSSPVGEEPKPNEGISEDGQQERHQETSLIQQLKSAGYADPSPLPKSLRAARRLEASAHSEEAPQTLETGTTPPIETIPETAAVLLSHPDGPSLFDSQPRRLRLRERRRQRAYASERGINEVLTLTSPIQTTTQEEAEFIFTDL
jgi:hypothetical protein